MAFHIPTGLDFYAKKSGTAPKFVTCESCGKEYVYIVSATGYSSGRASFFSRNKEVSRQVNATLKTREQVDLTWYWVTDAAIFIGGVGLVVYSWIHLARWDPNTLPLETRLKRAAQVSLTREAYADQPKAPKE
jgi:hypothetical protein